MHDPSALGGVVVAVACLWGYEHADLSNVESERCHARAMALD